MKQEEMRDKVKAIHEKYFVPYAKIAKAIGVSAGYISLFVKGERNLGDGVAYRLSCLLAERKWDL